MLIRKSNVFAIVFAGFTILMLFGCVMYLMTENSTDSPGPGLFLIPLCAGAAALLYPIRKGKPKEAPMMVSPAKMMKDPSRVQEQPVSEQPAPEPIPEQSPRVGTLISTFQKKEPLKPVGETWECPLCGQKIDGSKSFCPNCNTIRE